MNQENERNGGLLGLGKSVVENLKGNPGLVILVILVGLFLWVVDRAVERREKHIEILLEHAIKQEP